MKTSTACLLLLPVTLIWGAHFAVVKHALATVDPMAFGLARFGLAALLLFALTRVREGSVGLDRRDWGAMLWLGIAGSLSQVFWLYGLSYTTSGKTALLMATSPTFVALLRAAAGERLGWRAALGFVAALAGVALIVDAGAVGAGPLAGDLLVLAAAAGWGLYTNGGPRLLRRYSALRVTAYVFALTAAVMAVPGLGLLAATPRAGLGAGVWGGLAYSALLAGGLAWVLWYRGVNSLGPVRVMLYQYLVPLVALAISLAVLREPFRWAQGLGAVLVLAGTLAARLSLPAGAPGKTTAN
ncbi:MAG: DMT family transporter [bacterium]|nr:DMT family transporter [bacterium]